MAIDSGRHCRKFTTLWSVLGYVLFEKCDMNHMKQHRFFLEDKIVQIDTVLFCRKCMEMHKTLSEDGKESEAIFVADSSD